MRGRIYAIAADTGKIIWETYTVPKQPEDPDRGPQGTMPFEEMAKSWQNPPDVPISGGGSWTSYTLDPVKGHLFVPVGNPLSLIHI